ncbi:MAG: DNA repair protein RadC [Bacteroidales bacterium]|nr:DNA repair protein RadC [Bacteroidales bacterium]
MDKEVKKLGIKDWDENDRPREKMLLKGRKALSDAELIAILLGSGNRKETAVDLAQRILSDKKNNLNELSLISISELIKYQGIGEAKAISILAALELGNRRLKAQVLERDKISSSQEAYKYAQSLISSTHQEEFWVIFMDRSNKIIADKQISIGGLSSTIVDPKVVFIAALENKASGMILVHNHPSGNLVPSSADDKITERLINAGKLLEIQVLDHLILGSNTYYSYQDSSHRLFL